MKPATVWLVLRAEHGYETDILAAFFSIHDSNLYCEAASMDAPDLEHWVVGVKVMGDLKWLSESEKARLQ